MAEANNESQSSANTGTSTSLLELAHAAPAQAVDDSQETGDDAGDTESSRVSKAGYSQICAPKKVDGSEAQIVYTQGKGWTVAKPSWSRIPSFEGAFRA